jgi:stage III sporulation protein SpoIIIAA/predicted DNA-binding protein YlxM (UPF0122 family)
MNNNEDLEKLLDNFPFFIKKNLINHPKNDQLIEIVMDLGRRPEARFTNGSEYLSQKIVSWQDIDYITKRISKFSNENRAGIERTLHRISCMRNRQSIINGLTCRVGRVVFGSISLIRDLLESNQSILILGRPGVGKTTIIREIARVLSEEMEKRVVIVDTSNEIAGDSDIPHSGIGRARRLQVMNSELQHQVMVEAVENHMPEVIIIDEIGTELEALAARAISEKGVQLIGTTHGNCLENLIKNPSLVDLIGGIQYVTLSDDEAKRRGTQKSILERKAYPAFQLAVEINERHSWTIHEDVQSSIDLLLQGKYKLTQVRQISVNGKLQVKYRSYYTDNFSLFTQENEISSWKIHNKIKQNLTKTNNNFSSYEKNIPIFYCYSISSNLLKEAGTRLGFLPIITNNIEESTIIIGLKKHIKQNLKLQKFAQKKDIIIYSLNSVSLLQLTKLLKNVL